MSRARQLIDCIMCATRQNYMDFDVDSKERNAYAAISFLAVAVSHFIAALKHGPLSSQIPSGLEGTFLCWLISLEIKLRERLVEGCGRLSDWQSVVRGSMKNIRRQHKLLIIHTSVHHTDLNLDVRPQFESNYHGRYDIFQHANIQTDFLHDLNGDPGESSMASAQTYQLNSRPAPSLTASPSGNMSQHSNPDLLYEDVSPYNYPALSIPLDNSDQIQQITAPSLRDLTSNIDPFEIFDFEAQPPLFEGHNDYYEPSFQGTQDPLADTTVSNPNTDLDSHELFSFQH
ncbi:hypothetical protein BJ875DRAFT_455545 [Amylocarpus encephaloides]|uniref:Uncharacterized protein n=1 Tax=Amylocarpus encephaloides TaxID=45428 RepID=A0A9P8C965_9HELO|nr:hypothetical protein BJ875DRAFT_455545 [Amylocarpus encephaloides]